MLDAFDVGVLTERLRSSQAGFPGAKNDDQEEKEVLHAASRVLGRPITAVEFSTLRTSLVDAMCHRSLGQRVRGSFNFINLMWLAGIFGITVSVGPFLYFISRPFRRLLKRLIARASALLQQLLRNVLIPAIIRLHRAGAFEGLFH